MKIFENFQEWRKFRSTLSTLPSPQSNAKGLGFVPTMGALHMGHLELIRQSKKENRFTVVSIFVNPTQFNDPKDFEKYPKTFDQDQALLRAAGVDFLIYPSYEQMYPDNFQYFVDEKEWSSLLCGAGRPGHFRGVLTVVMKLLNGVDADNAYFGEKDFQQLSLVQGMADAFFLKTKIVGCPTIREEDGLAMSSRNRRLSSSDRTLAPHLAMILKDRKKSLPELRGELERLGFRVEYLEEHRGRRFVAAHLGDVRLIDNVKI